MLDTTKHPCFNKEASKSYGRVHLPVAPKCNVQCNFCNRNYDCVNESRPGVTSSILSPGQAEWFFDEMTKKCPISVAGIAGPGDPFADPEPTLKTMALLREKHPEVLLCVSSNGLNVLSSVNELAKIGVSHVTITVNAVKADIGAKIYSWIRLGKRTFRGEEAATLLLENQLAAIASLKDHGITVKINTIVIPGINDHHIAEIAEEMKKRGADIFNCIPMIPVEGAAFGDLTEPDHQMMWKIREDAGKFIPQMKHCQRCRADAAGLIGDKDPAAWLATLKEAGSKSMNPGEIRPFIAIASREGFLINQHLGEAADLAIYTLDENGQVQLKERRKTPTTGTGDRRWENLADSFSDCKAIVVNGIGVKPKKILENKGLKVYQVEGLLEDAASKLFSGNSLASMSCRSQACGTACKGSGGGCG